MKKAMSLLLTPLMLFLGCGTGTASIGSYRQLTMQEAIDMMALESDYIILDVRTQAEYETGHIPGAICIPNETIGTDKISGLPDQNQLIFVYCRSGNRSKQAAGKLIRAGYANIVEIGGIYAWPGEIATGNHAF